MRPSDIKILRRELEEYRALQSCLALGNGWRERALERNLARRAESLAAALWEVSCQIAAIPDPEVRLIFELRYFRGLSWSEVAEALPTRLSADGARMKHDRYLKKKRPDAKASVRKTREGQPIREDGSVGLSLFQSS